MPRRLIGLLTAAALVAAGLTGTAPAQATPSPDDPTLHVDPSGRTYYVDPAPAQPPATSSRPVSPRTTAPTSAVPALNSRPGSLRTIELDFDGRDVTAMNWRGVSGWQGGFDLDGSPGTFTSTEVAAIREIWERTAEFYAPFDVNVTTVDPGLAAINRTSSSDTRFGIRLLVSHDADAHAAICNSSCAGVAFTKVFDDPSANAYRLGWVFPAGAFNRPDMIAHSAAHEAGHTLGLDHDGVVLGSAYYFGNAIWGALMGGGSGSAVVQFSNGDYPRANNSQDDLAVIAAHGLSMRPDIGNTPATAHRLTTSYRYSWSSQINSRTDVDVVRFEHPCATPITVTARGPARGQTLDIGLRLLDGRQRQIAAADPDAVPNGSFVAAGMDAGLTAATTSGPYYVMVDGMAAGVSPNGWSDYGSVGSYTLGISGCALKPGRVTMRTASSGARGGRVTATARWNTAPSNGAAIRSYRVRATKLNSRNQPVRHLWSAELGASHRSLAMRLPKGRYRFRVVASNRVGTSPLSAWSRIVTAR